MKKFGLLIAFIYKFRGVHTSLFTKGKIQY